MTRCLVLVCLCVAFVKCVCSALRKVRKRKITENKKEPPFSHSFKMALEKKKKKKKKLLSRFFHQAQPNQLQHRPPTQSSINPHAALTREY
ncbi:hypothetical protein QBC43DRAFT_326263, partial [Cladorrhinum sp. PSN259]